MKTQHTLLIGGGLFGLGLLLYYLFQADRPETGNTFRKTERPPAAKPERKAVMRVVKSPKKTVQNPAPISKPKVLEKPKTDVKQVPLVAKKQAIPAPLKTKPAKVIKPPIADEFPLRLGSKGHRVERLNVFLTRNYGWRGKITDEFDERTLKQVRRLNKKGEVDARTYKRMRMARPVHQQIIIR